LYRTLIPYYTNEDGINERIDVGFNHDFNWEENNHHNYSDFIRDFNRIHPLNNDNDLLHPPDYNNKLLHPPHQGIIPLYDENGYLNPDIRNIQEYYRNPRNSHLLDNPLNYNNIIHPPRQVPCSFSFTDPAFRNNYIQHPNLPLTPLEEFRQALRIQRRKKKKMKKKEKIISNNNGVANFYFF
jgi:hypothetical protein